MLPFRIRIRFREADPDLPKWNGSDRIRIHHTECYNYKICVMFYLFLSINRLKLINSLSGPFNFIWIRTNYFSLDILYSPGSVSGFSLCHLSQPGSRGLIFKRVWSTRMIYLYKFWLPILLACILGKTSHWQAIYIFKDFQSIKMEQPCDAAASLERLPSELIVHLQKANLVLTIK